MQAWDKAQSFRRTRYYWTKEQALSAKRSRQEADRAQDWDYIEQPDEGDTLLEELNKIKPEDLRILDERQFAHIEGRADAMQRARVRFCITAMCVWQYALLPCNMHAHGSPP
jgi:hypothetical protein